MTRRVVLWRHGRTEWNVAGRVQGQTDTALDEVGVRQAAAAAARLASLRPVRILSSDLQRARHTAEELSRLTGVPVELDERLREMNFGEREGLTWKESWERFPDLMKAMLEDREERFPGAELHAEAGLRVGVCTFLGFPEATWRTFAGLSNCSWIALEQISPEHDTRWRLTEWNAGTLPEPVMSDDG